MFCFVLYYIVCCIGYTSFGGICIGNAALDCCNATLSVSAQVAVADTTGPYSDKITALYVYDNTGECIKSSREFDGHVSFNKGVNDSFFNSAYSVHWCGDYSRTLTA